MNLKRHKWVIAWVGAVTRVPLDAVTSGHDQGQDDCKNMAEVQPHPAAPAVPIHIKQTVVQAPGHCSRRRQPCVLMCTVSAATALPALLKHCLHPLFKAAAAAVAVQFRLLPTHLHEDVVTEVSLLDPPTPLHTADIPCDTVAICTGPCPLSQHCCVFTRLAFPQFVCTLLPQPHPAARALLQPQAP